MCERAQLCNCLLTHFCPLFTETCSLGSPTRTRLTPHSFVSCDTSIATCHCSLCDLLFSWTQCLSEVLRSFWGSADRLATYFPSSGPEGLPSTCSVTCAHSPAFRSAQPGLTHVCSSLVPEFLIIGSQASNPSPSNPAFRDKHCRRLW